MDVNAEAHGAGSNSREKAVKRLRLAFRRGGPTYASLHGLRWIVRSVMQGLEQRLVHIEQRRRIVEPWAVSATRFTTQDNKALWNTYDWSARGEEWTSSDEWKRSLVDEFMTPYVPQNGVVVEVGPGAGRWTEFLQQRASKCILVDIAEQALSLCRERFSDFSNLEYLISEGCRIGTPDLSVDAVWSYDVFVHINPLDTQSYFREFRRILKSGGRAVIHHPGNPSTRTGVRPGWRSDVTEDLVLDFASASGLQRLRRTDQYVNPGDVLSVFIKASA